MKNTVITVCAFIALHSSALYAKDVCNDPRTIQEAKTQLTRSFNYDDTVNIDISNIEKHNLNDGSVVCTGKVSTSAFETISLWQAGIVSGVAEVNIIQPIDPTHFKTTALYDQQEKERQAQQQQDWQQAQMRRQQQRQNQNNLGAVGGRLNVIGIPH